LERKDALGAKICRLCILYTVKEVDRSLYETKDGDTVDKTSLIQPRDPFAHHSCIFSKGSRRDKDSTHRGDARAIDTRSVRNNLSDISQLENNLPIYVFKIVDN
jgi:hypothetical protein